MNDQNDGMFHSSLSEMRLEINKLLLMQKSIAEQV